MDIKKQLPYINLENIVFKDIISYSSSYGIVWKGTYKGKPCAIKMIVLTSGDHFDKTNGVYVGNESSFTKKNKVPYLHHYFKRKRAMSKSLFKLEIYNQYLLNNDSLSPKIHMYGKSHHINDIQYGFIVMDLLDKSLRDVIRERKLHEPEKKLITEMFINLHVKKHMVHGDSKPANIGVNLDSKGNIKQVMFFDFRTLKSKKDMTEEEFDKGVKSDISYFTITYNIR